MHSRSSILDSRSFLILNFKFTGFGGGVMRSGLLYSLLVFFVHSIIEAYYVRIVKLYSAADVLLSRGDL